MIACASGVRPHGGVRRHRRSVLGWSGLDRLAAAGARVGQGARRAAERRQPLLRRPDDDRRRAAAGAPATADAVAKLDRLLRADPEVTSVSRARPRRERPLPADRRRRPPRPGEPAGAVVRRPAARHADPRRALPRLGARARRRRRRLRRRLRLAHARLVPLADPRRARAHLPAARARVPLAAAAAEGDRAEPADRRRRERPDDRGLPVGLGQLGRASCRSTQIEGWIPVFMFTLLFGLSMDYEVFLDHADARGVGRDALEHRRGRARAREHRPDRHRRRADHGRDVQRLDVRLDPDRCSSSASGSRSRS